MLFYAGMPEFINPFWKHSKLFAMKTDKCLEVD